MDAASGRETVVQSAPLLTTNGPAVGRITGFNHILGVVQDMETTLHFYRDLLGLEVFRTLGDDYIPVGTSDGPSWPVAHSYFFRLPDSSFLALVEVEGLPRPQPSCRSPNPWPGDHDAPVGPQKCDHLAFEVAGHDDLAWFRDHLRAQGVETSDVRAESGTPHCGHAIYFTDPSGNPLAITCQPGA